MKVKLRCEGQNGRAQHQQLRVPEGENSGNQREAKFRPIKTEHFLKLCKI